MTNKTRGFSHERDLVKKLYNKGFAVMRAPASGARATKIFYPDIVAIYRGKVISIEAKTAVEKRPIYLTGEQVTKLVSFSSRAGGEAYIAVKYVGMEGWKFVPVDKLKGTESGLYKIDVEDVERAEDLETLVNRIKNEKLNVG